MSSKQHDKDIFSFKYKNENISLYLPNHGDFIQSRIRNKKQFYESALLDDLYTSGLSGKTVIDVGANIGNHTVFFAKVAKARKVYCFEPFKDMFNILKRNIELNGLGEKIRAYNLAVGKSKGKGTMKIRNIANLGMNRVQQDSSGDVEIDSLDNILLSSIDSVDLIKIDVEGMELDVLQGSRQILQKFKPDLCIEANTEIAFNKTLELLSKYNYKFVKQFKWTPTYLFSSN